MALAKGTRIAGEHGDRRFSKHGRDWRVRVRFNEHPTSAPINGDPTAVAPEAIGAVISVSALDSAGNVAVDPQGKFLVFEPLVVSFMAEGFRAGGDHLKRHHGADLFAALDRLVDMNTGTLKVTATTATGKAALDAAAQALRHAAGIGRVFDPETDILTMIDRHIDAAQAELNGRMAMASVRDAWAPPASDPLPEPFDQPT